MAKRCCTAADHSPLFKNNFTQQEAIMSKFRVGIQLHPQHTSYASLAQAARRADALGVDSIWVWDHFFPLHGDPNGNHFEAYTLLAALAANCAELGTGDRNSYRNPQLLLT
jgi:alkanesulfonate monooxygenase SsuD/methylene tetrahydromethanopterin reductase-like flavin-dependent oxidoreductase (luciferase family)